MKRKTELKRAYKCLTPLAFAYRTYKLVPIRDEDKYAIMQWRNEQIDILRQKETLAKGKQEWYFKNIVDKLFEQEKPDQLLFSFLEDNILIGYGGLVHIDWESRNAEISFLTATDRNLNQFVDDWKCYLKILKNIANLYLDFSKIYTYAYDIRPQLFQALTESNFVEEARLKDHVSINNKQYDVLIHSHFFDRVHYRMANEEDVLLYYKWANDSVVRNNSFNKDVIEYDSHCKWFFSKLSSDKCFLYLFFNKHNIPIGQVRIENTGIETIIGISIDEKYRGRAFSNKMLIKATEDYLSKHSKEKIVAYIKHGNIASLKSFISAGFIEQEIMNHEEVKCYKLFKSKT